MSWLFWQRLVVWTLLPNHFYNLGVLCLSEGGRWLGKQPALFFLGCSPWPLLWIYLLEGCWSLKICWEWSLLGDHFYAAHSLMNKPVVLVQHFVVSYLFFIFFGSSLFSSRATWGSFSSLATVCKPFQISDVPLLLCCLLFCVLVCQFCFTRISSFTRMFINSSLLSHMNLMSACLFFIEGRVNPSPESGAALCVCKFDAAFREFYFLFIYFCSQLLWFSYQTIFVFFFNKKHEWLNIYFLFALLVLFLLFIMFPIFFLFIFVFIYLHFFVCFVLLFFCIFIFLSCVAC